MKKLSENFFMKKIISLLLILLLQNCSNAASFQKIFKLSKEEQLREAIGKSDANHVQKLISENANVNHAFRLGFTPLMDAYNNLEITKSLLNAGANVNQASDNGCTALSMAATYGHNKEVLIILHKAGAKIDAQNDQGETPLMCAARAENLICLRFLVEHGADKTVKNKKNQTAYHIAQEFDHCPESRVLLNTCDCKP